MFFLSMIQHCWHFTVMLESKQIYMHGLCLRWHFQRYATCSSMICLLYHWKIMNPYQMCEERIILCTFKCLRIQKIKLEYLLFIVSCLLKVVLKSLILWNVIQWTHNLTTETVHIVLSFGWVYWFHLQVYAAQ
jgi:hypothetical protein